MDRDVHLRQYGLVVDDDVAHAVGPKPEADHRAQLDVGRWQRLHDVEESLADRGTPAAVNRASLGECAGRVVPDDGEAIVAAHDELIEDADRPTRPAASAAWVGQRQTRRIHLRVTRI